MSAPLPVATDVTGCDREPIHLPGSIQPHGFLLALEPETGRIREASANLRAFTGCEARAALGRTLADVLGAGVATTLQDVARDPLFTRRALHLRRLRVELEGGGRTLALVAHRRGERIIVEGEEVERAGLDQPVVEHQLEPFLGRLESARHVEELFALATAETRRITGFDRALVYQFDADWHGTVVGESRNDVLPSYLGLRFPASDIPRQARELYRLNRLRLIARASYAPVPILGLSDAGDGAGGEAGALDLSLSTLRSVSPVHLEYMRNMGTGSSMSISLLRGGELWGLISCHSREPRVVPFATRVTCDLLGQFFSLQLASLEQAGALGERRRLGAILTRLLTAMSQDDNLGGGLDGGDLLAFAAAGGAAVVDEGRVVRFGQVPDDPRIQKLVTWLAARGGEDVFATHELGRVHPPAADLAAAASGLLAVRISQARGTYLLWFRPEWVRTVTWGGEPQKLPAPGREQLSPRTSFEAWKQIVHGTSRPWEQAILDLAAEFRTGIVDLVLRRAEERAQLTGELQRINKELEAFSYTVSHDLRAPFRHIRGYAELLSLDKADLLDDEGREFLQKILDSAGYAGALVDNMLRFAQMRRTALQVEDVDLDAMVARMRGAFQAQLGGREIRWEVGPLPSVRADGSLLTVVMQNLLDNAVKYSRDRRPAVITVSACEARDEHVIRIADNGAGFDMKYADKLFGVFQRLHSMEQFDGVGIGLASVQRIVQRHGGRAWAQAELDKGATFFFSLPKTPASRPAPSDA